MLMLVCLVILTVVYGSGATFSNWNEWSACSAECGKGIKSREKILKPSNNESCYSAVIEKKECNIQCRRLKNLALNKTATASSQFLKVYPAGNAIDGITNSNLYGKSCMHTGKDKTPWLRVDLTDFGIVEQVVVHNRADCCTERLNNLVVTVGNNSDGSGNKVCGKRADMNNESVARFHCCERIYGRYVHLKIPGPQFLHVCEVEILGELISNLAVGKRATQSSTRYPANRAVDGRKDAWSGTSQDNQPWLRVDLEKEAVVQKVLLYGYNAAGIYIENAKITIGNDNNGKLVHTCGTADSSNSFMHNGYKAYNVTCQTDVKGRFVQVQLMRTDHLVMREVEVYGYYY